MPQNTLPFFRRFVAVDLGLECIADQIRACTICDDLPLGPKPIFQLSSKAKILIVRQAPGRITHEKGIPFDDTSGVRLRSWLGLSPDQFYDPGLVAIVPNFAFPLEEREVSCHRAMNVPPNGVRNFGFAALC